eukprot:TRINITY_DN2085_c0_g2_i12.p3 TRINITY_DN2085_c0_g2~~TRINITY_DN2085_c0_g2_i12.p3  ORF type:complete len:112 (-),score=45.99 TRINITY_DN2085_c0_g2_i12:30-365(-)
MRGKELVGDAVNEFERRRDVPVRYSRTLVMKTIQAMKRIEEIRQRRVRRLWVKRMMAVKQQKTKALEKELEKHPNLVTNETLKRIALELSLIHICRCRRLLTCRSRWSPYH